MHSKTPAKIHRNCVIHDINTSNNLKNNFNFKCKSINKNNTWDKIQ